MITDKHRNTILEKMLEAVELPPGAYELANGRYKDLGEWFARKESTLAGFDPHIFAQGSFRLGTAIKPLTPNELYDLDLACKLRKGISVETHSQEAVKELVRRELEAYRVRRNIQRPLEVKHRCWRLEYQDTVGFHMDIVPCVPATAKRTDFIANALIKGGDVAEFARSASQTTVVITDDRHPEFKTICDDWNISNPEGYAKWFEGRLRDFNLRLLNKATVDEIPIFMRKTPLQQAVQLLKRHRDQMFAGASDRKPISIIITTLAARAFRDEQDVASALTNILAQMGSLVRTSTPRVPNPVDPDEDFADRWSRSECRKLNLEQNFWNWLQQAQNDFAIICESDNVDFIASQAQRKFAISLNPDSLAKSLGGAVSARPLSAKPHIIVKPAEPWTAE